MRDPATVIVTRAREHAGRLSEKLRDRGFRVVECPLVAIEPIPGKPIRVEGYDWLVVTSRAAVPLVLERIEGARPRVAAIGPGTAEELRERGVEPDLVASRSTQEGLLAEMPRPAGRVLFAGAENARALLAGELGADVVALYRTVEVQPERFPDGDLVVLASASAARVFASLGGACPCVSIGPETTRAARASGLDVVAEAATSDLEGLVAAVRLAASRLASSPS